MPLWSKKLKDWWEELEQEVKKPTMTPVPQPIPKQQNVAARTTKHAIDSVNPNYFEEKHSNYKNAEFALAHQPVQHLEVMDNDNTRSTHKPLNINLKSNDEVRRAFVYSEIFNRKY
ncbi:hypothetical protein FACS1894180_6900 [Bacteroidia bacterium]|nr:hypothetical protein FACS1894180_6900 [Bacteroidia bacterium]